MQRRAQAIVEQAVKLAATLQKKDLKGAKTQAQSMVKGLDMLAKALDVKLGDLKKQSTAIEAAMAARQFQRAATVAKTLAESARIFADPAVQTVRRMGPGAGRLLASVEQEDSDGALFLLSLFLWSERAFSPEEASMAAKAGMSAGQLEAALEQRHQKSALKLAKDLASAAGPFAQSALKRSQKLMEPCLQLRQALERGNRSVAFDKMTAHLTDLRAVGLSETRMTQALQDLMALHDALENAPLRHKLITALIQATQELSQQAGERAKRMAALGDDLVRLIQAENYAGAMERLRELQQDRALRDARVGVVLEAAPQGWQAALKEKAPSQALKLLDTATSKAASLKETATSQAANLKGTVATKALSGLLDSMRRPKE